MGKYALWMYSSICKSISLKKPLISMQFGPKHNYILSFAQQLPVMQDMFIRFDNETLAERHVEVLQTLLDTEPERIKRIQANLDKYQRIFQYSVRPNFPKEAGWTLAGAGVVDEMDDAFTMLLKEFTMRALSNETVVERK